MSQKPGTTNVWEENNIASFDFLMTEIEAGLAFAHGASTASSDQADKVKRNTENARKAYDTVMRFQDRVSFSEDQRVKFEAGVSRLKEAMRGLF